MQNETETETDQNKKLVWFSKTGWLELSFRVFWKVGKRQGGHEKQILASAKGYLTP